MYPLLTPNFYIVKLGFTWVILYTFFVNFDPKHRLWVDLVGAATINPAGTWRHNDVRSTSCHDVASTLILRHYDVMCPLGMFLDFNQYFGESECLTQGHNTMPPLGIEPRTARFGVRCSSTTTQPCSVLTKYFTDTMRKQRNGQ